MNITMKFNFHIHVGLYAPLDIRGFCSVVGWRMPRQPNGKLLTYDIHLYSPSADDSESILATVNSDQTYFALSDDQHIYKQSGSLVQVTDVCICLMKAGYVVVLDPEFSLVIVKCRLPNTP